MIERRIYDAGLTSEEQKILGELKTRLNTLADDPDGKARAVVYNEIAGKYGVSVIVLYNIEWRAEPIPD